MKTSLEVLQIPLHKLRFLDVIGPDPLAPDELELVFRVYTAGEVDLILESLEWGSRNPDYPFASLVPGIKCSHTEAYQYIVHLLGQMQSHKRAREFRGRRETEQVGKQEVENDQE